MWRKVEDQEQSFEEHHKKNCSEEKSLSYFSHFRTKEWDDKYDLNQFETAMNSKRGWKTGTQWYQKWQKDQGGKDMTKFVIRWQWWGDHGYTIFFDFFVNLTSNAVMYFIINNFKNNYS